MNFAVSLPAMLYLLAGSFHRLVPKVAKPCPKGTPLEPLADPFSRSDALGREAAG